MSKEIITSCPSCSKIFNAYKPRNKIRKFCSRSCANSRGPRTEEFKAKLRKKLTGLKHSDEARYRISIGKGGTGSPKQITTCIVCGKSTGSFSRKTCSVECFKIRCSDGGKTSANKLCKRSKNEIELYQLCSTKWPNVTHNEPIINGWDADIIIPHVKVAVLWNGPWHYQEMSLKNHSLKQVQTRDKIKQFELEKAGWIVISFEDRSYTPLTAFNHLMVVLAGIEPATNSV